MKYEVSANVKCSLSYTNPDLMELDSEEEMVNIAKDAKLEDVDKKEMLKSAFGDDKNGTIEITSTQIVVKEVKEDGTKTVVYPVLVNCPNKAQDQVEKNFAYHAPKTEQIPVYEQIRACGKGFAQYLIENVPDSRERSIALTKIEEAVMWANAGVARN